MTEEITTPDPQAGDGAQINPLGQAPTTPPTDPQAGDSQKPPRSAEEYERMIAELRKESASHRTKLKKFEDEESKRAEAQMTEQQKKDKQLADLQKAHDEAVRSHQEYKINSEVKLQAAQMGFADVADAVRLLDWAEITYDDEGTPNNVKELLAKLLKTKPYLAVNQSQPQRPQTAGGATSPARSQSSNQPVTQEYINRLTPQEYEALSPERKQEIRQWQATHMFRFGQRR